jgi:hypothetical protein
MANNQQLRLTLRLHIAECDGVAESTKLADAEIVTEHRLSWRDSMDILRELRCAHENLAHECSVCAHS